MENSTKVYMNKLREERANRFSLKALAVLSAFGIWLGVVAYLWLLSS